MMNSKQRKNNWTEYWSDSSISSCSEGIRAKDSDIDKFWARAVNVLSGDSRVLDLCTGRGDVIWRLINQQENSASDISVYTGVDLSDLDDNRVLQRFEDKKSKVKFEYNTPITQLPFTDKHFDLITSQFGIEYCLSRESISEVFRVLKDSGEARLILHNQGSVMVEVAKEELSNINFLLLDSDYLLTMAKLIPVFAKLRNPANIKKLNKDQEAVALRARFNFESNRLIEAAENSDVPDVFHHALEFSQEVFELAKNKGNTAAKDALKKFEYSLKSSKQRMKELIQVALSNKDIENLESYINSCDRTVTQINELTSNKKIVAWGIEVI